MDIDWIEKGVLAASACPVDVTDLVSVWEQGIRAVVTLTEFPLTALRGITPAVLAEMGITCCHAPIRDFDRPTVNQAWEVVEFIERMQMAHQPTLIHCLAGEGRTGTMLHVYYLAKGAGLSAVIERIKTLRPRSQYDRLSQTQRDFLVGFGKTVS